MKNSSHLSGFRVGFILTILSLVIFYIGIPFFELVELKAYDLHFSAEGKSNVGSEVVIVTIDEKSIDELGRWPWPRSTMAALVESLNEYKASVIAFDIVFSEADNTSGIKYYDELKDTLVKKGFKVSSIIDRLSATKDNDVLFASAIKKSPQVILGYYFYTTDDEIAHRKKDVSSAKDKIYPAAIEKINDIDGLAITPDIITTRGIEENIAPLSKATKRFGYFNVVPDVDGTIRRAPLVMEYGGKYYPHLALAAVRAFVDSPELKLNFAEYGMDSLMLGNHRVVTDERGAALINYRGKKKSFAHYSFSDVLSGKVEKDALAGKIVLVGATATGIYDLRVTPVDITFPGVEIHATIIDNIMANDFIQRPDWVFIFDVLAILILGIFLSIFIPRLKALSAALTMVVISALYIYFNNYLFTNMNMWLTVVYPLFTIIIVTGGVSTFQYMTEERKKREIKNAFSHYVSPSLVDIVVKNPDILRLGGEE
ncbi:MAG: CHASE2 domain-containing protein, partial [Proteobacteria bacterium]|nr:CHASE2 domain-containing protein [Pseudomonadota bacterium]